jgi:hypothetical protein
MRLAHKLRILNEQLLQIAALIHVTFMKFFA